MNNKSIFLFLLSVFAFNISFSQKKISYKNAKSKGYKVLNNSPVIAKSKTIKISKDSFLFRNNKRNQISSKIQKPLKAQKADDYKIIKSIKSKNGSVKFLKVKYTGKSINSSKKDFKNNIDQFLNQNSKDLAIENKNNISFKIKNSNVDKSGKLHVKYEQKIDEIEVFGSDLVFHLDNNFKVEKLTGFYSISNNSKKDIKIDSSNALKIILKYFKVKREKVSAIAKSFGEDIKPKLVWYEKENKLYLSWYFDFHSSIIDSWDIFIDTESGEMIDLIHGTCEFNNNSPQNSEATGYDLLGNFQTFNTFKIGDQYSLIDASKSMYKPNNTSRINDLEGVIITTKLISNTIYVQNDFDNHWEDSTLVSAHNNTSIVYDYFYNTFNYESLNGVGVNLNVVTNVLRDGEEMDNAYWNGWGMFYGNGNKFFNKSLAASLDVVAHEYTHGIIEYSANLEYRGESGAINESIADIFGTLIDRDDWLMGEDIITNGFLRSLENPKLNNQPDHYNDFFETENDNGGVHTNSGIPNKVYYLIANTIGKDKAEQLYWHALQYYLNRFSDFSELRIAISESASDIFGNLSQEKSIVDSSFDDVGIFESKDDIPEKFEIKGSDYLLGYNVNQNNNTTFYITDKNGENLRVISESLTNSKPSVSGDGKLIVFVTDENELRGINISGDSFSEYSLSNSKIWRSVAISKDKSKIALTTEERENNIQVYDFNSSKWKSFELYTPTTGSDVKSFEVQYADALEWDNKSEYLIFDELNLIKNSEGSDLTYWDIASMKVWNSKNNNFDEGLIFKLYSTLPPNVSIGYPAFSKTSNNYIAFDWIAENQSYLVLYDLVNNKINSLQTNSWSVPSFSSDDKKLIFSSYKDSSQIKNVSIDLKNIEFLSEPTKLIDNSYWGVWFNIGLRDYDGDGISSDYDYCPNTPSGEDVDENGCSLSQKDRDNDGILDDLDNCPLVSNPDQLDSDGDGIGDVCDDDDDNDGIEDSIDNCPNTPYGDPINSNGCSLECPVYDVIPGIYTLTLVDSYGDGWNGASVDVTVDGTTTSYTISSAQGANASHTFTIPAGASTMSFAYTNGDWDSEASYTITYTKLDGTSEQTALSDGPSPIGGIKTLNICLDFDKDGVQDAEDAFPFDETEWLDTDDDGVGNNTDTDDDNDGQSDADEIACNSDPLDNSSLAPDYDQDGIPDCIDEDNDNDGYLDENDAFPFDETEWFDTDDDGVGNNTDTDDDNDGYLDIDEITCDSDSLDATSTPLDSDNDGILNCFDEDDDNDGILDTFDQCPNTTLGVNVDANGCEIFLLPANNFSVAVISSTCVGSENGSISISAQNQEYSYTASISGQSPVVLNSSNNFEASISGLGAGNYDVCFTVAGVESYNQCFSVTVSEPAPLSTSAKIDLGNRSVDLSLNGSTSYNILLNGAVIKTTESNLSLDLKPGMNYLSISTDLDCQGTYFEEIFVSEDVLAYPNPTDGMVQLYIGGTDDTVTLNVYDISSQNIISKSFEVSSSRVIEADISRFKTGLYFFVLNGKTIKTTHKIIKK